MKARRRGTTLLETIVLMGAIAVMLAVAVTSIQALVAVERANRREATADLKIDRLAAAFRDDVHAARGQSLVQAGPEATLTLDLGAGRAAVYVAGPGGVRVEHRPGGEAPARVERFAPAGCRVALAEVPAEAGAPARLRLTIRRGEGQPEAVALRVEAVPGRDRPDFAAATGEGRP
jgi:type II secretory pathway pseudopilin PulG